MLNNSLSSFKTETKSKQNFKILLVQK